MDLLPIVLMAIVIPIVMIWVVACSSNKPKK